MKHLSSFRYECDAMARALGSDWRGRLMSRFAVLTGVAVGMAFAAALILTSGIALTSIASMLDQQVSAW